MRMADDRWPKRVRKHVPSEGREVDQKKGGWTGYQKQWQQEYSEWKTAMIKRNGIRDY